MQAMNPANAMAGFRKAGVFPFNRKAINVHCPDTTPPVAGETDKERTLSEVDCVPSIVNDTTAATLTASSIATASVAPSTKLTKSDFSDEQIAQYERRFEEGYDLPDPEYLQWLEENHSEALPTDRYELVSSEGLSTTTPLLSIVNEFSSIAPLDQLDCHHHTFLFQEWNPHKHTLFGM